MTTPEKCEAIIRAIVDRANVRHASGKDEWAIAFGPDWGGFALTVYDPEKGHTHVGGIHEGSTFEHLVDSLHAQLTEGRGLSWE